MALKRPTSNIYNQHPQLEATYRHDQWDRRFVEQRKKVAGPEQLDDFWGKGSGNRSISQASHKKQLRAPTELGCVDASGETILELEDSSDPLLPPMIATDASRNAARQRRFAQAPPAAKDALGMISSPSRGDHIAEGLDITKCGVQEEFHAKLQKIVDAYHAKYAETELAALYEGPQRDELQNILLEFRKLREGLIAAKRVDNFAVRVYEQSVELAIEAGNFSQLASALPPLVYELHAAQSIKSMQSEDVDQLAAGLQSVTLAEDQGDLDKRCLFASYLLLTQIAGASLQTAAGFEPFRSKFWSAYRTLTVKPIGIYDRDYPVLSTTNRHLQLALAVFRAVNTNNWPLLRRMLDEGTGENDERSSGQVILIRGCVERVRKRTFEVAASVYLESEVSFVVKMLLFNGWWSDGDESKEGKDELLRCLSKPPNGFPSFIGDHEHLYTEGRAGVPLKRAAQHLGVLTPAVLHAFYGQWRVKAQ